MNLAEMARKIRYEISQVERKKILLENYLRSLQVVAERGLHLHVIAQTVEVQDALVLDIDPKLWMGSNQDSNSTSWKLAARPVLEFGSFEDQFNQLRSRLTLVRN